MRPTLLLIVIIALQQTAVCKVVNFKEQAVHSSVIQKGGSRAERAEHHFGIPFLSLLPVYPGASYFYHESLNLFTCKVKLIR